jgi:hypothetical protein
MTEDQGFEDLRTLIRTFDIDPITRPDADEVIRRGRRHRRIRAMDKALAAVAVAAVLVGIAVVATGEVRGGAAPPAAGHDASLQCALTHNFAIEVPGGGNDSTLLAPTNATKAVLCVYSRGNTNAPLSTLLGSAPVADVTRLSTALNQSTVPTPECRGPGASWVDVVMFARPSGDPVVVTANRGGCPFVASTLNTTTFMLSTAGDRALTTLDAAVPGTLAGRFLMEGGPAPGVTNPLRGFITILGPGVRMRVSVGQDGKYSVALPPGNYTLSGESPQVMSNSGPLPCRAAQTASVTAHTQLNLDTICLVP